MESVTNLFRNDHETVISTTDLQFCMEDWKLQLFSTVTGLLTLFVCVYIDFFFKFLTSFHLFLFRGSTVPALPALFGQKAGGHPVQVGSLSQGHMKTNNHLSNLESSGLWEGTRGPWVGPFLLQGNSANHYAPFSFYQLNKILNFTLNYIIFHLSNILL